MSIRVKCGRCDGHGDVPLAAHLREILVLIPTERRLTTRRIVREVNVGRRPAVSPTAINNRLTKLEELGLVDSERDGKHLAWRRL